MADSITGLLPDNTTIYRVNPSNNIKAEILRTKLLFGSRAGVDRVQVFDSNLPNVLSYQYHDVSRQEQKDTLDFLHARRGRLEAFWTFGHRTEFELAANASSGQAFIEVYDNRLDFQGYERIYILFNNSSDIVVRKIASVSAPSGGTVQLTLDTVLDRDVNIDEVEKIGRLLLVRFDNDKPAIKYLSSDVFEMELKFVELVKDYAEPEITVVIPNGGEVWETTETRKITWSGVNVGGNCKIELFKGGGFNSTIIGSISVALEEYDWIIPQDQTVGSDYRVKITSLLDGSVLDESNADFTINKKTELITVLTPNGGEVWLRETENNITWATEGIIDDNMTIRLWKGGGPLSTIATDIPNNGVYPWTIPTNLLGTDFKIRVYKKDLSLFDESDGNFQIAYFPRSIDDIIKPNENSVWFEGQKVKVQWTSTGFLPADEVRIRLRETVGDFILQQWTNQPAGTSPAEVEIELNDNLILTPTKSVYIQVERTSLPSSGNVIKNSDNFTLIRVV